MRTSRLMGKSVSSSPSKATLLVSIEIALIPFNVRREVNEDGATLVAALADLPFKGGMSFEN